MSPEGQPEADPSVHPALPPGALPLDARTLRAPLALPDQDAPSAQASGPAKRVKRKKRSVVAAGLQTTPPVRGRGLETGPNVRRETDTFLGLTALEASLLVLAAFFATGAGVAFLAPGDSPAPWAIRQVGPPLVLLLGALLAARRWPRLLPTLGAWPATARHAAAALALGLLGGAFLVAPTLPNVLAPPLEEAAALIWSLVWVVCCIPAIEEVYFRGVLFGALQQAGGVRLAVAVSAIFFALAHQPASLGAWGFTLLLGLGLGWVRGVSRALLPPLLAHAGWNLGTIGHALAVRAARGEDLWAAPLAALLLTLALARRRRRCER